MRFFCKISFLIIFYFLVACDKASIEEPIAKEPENSTLLEPGNTPTPVAISISETKEPYVTLADKGFEAILIMSGIDKDNQINGKVAVEDIKGVTTLQRLNGDDAVKSGAWDRIQYIKEKYGEIPFIASLDDIRHFPDLKHIFYLGTGIKDLDLTANTQLETIIFDVPQFTSLDLRGLQKLKSIRFAGYFNWNPGEIIFGGNNSLEDFLGYGHSSKIDMSDAKNLKHFHYYTMSPYLTEFSLDLTKNKKLESINFYNTGEVFKSGHRKILISKETRKNIENALCTVILSEAKLEVAED